MLKYWQINWYNIWDLLQNNIEGRDLGIKEEKVYIQQN